MADVDLSRISLVPEGRSWGVPETGTSILSRLNGLADRLTGPANRASYIPEIDGLRGIAILAVLVWHASLRADRYMDSLHAAPSWYDYFPHGEIGVCLFFFVSGFLLASPFAKPSASPFRLASFYKRRFLRIYPPYVVALAVCLVLVCASGFRGGHTRGPALSSFLASLFYLHSFVFNSPSLLNPPVWSLEVEAQFYLLAPFLIRGYFAIQPAGRRRCVGVALTAFALALLLVVNVGLPTEERFRLGLLTHFPLFLGGIIMADVHVPGARMISPDRPPGRTRGFDGLFAVGAIGYIAMGLWFTVIDAKPRGGAELALANAGLLLLTIALAVGALRGAWSGEVLRNRWLRLTGTMCFSIYLCHVPVLQMLASTLLPHLHAPEPAIVYPLTIVGGGLVAMLVSLAFHIAVERPCLQLGRTRREVSPAL